MPPNNLDFKPPIVWGKFLKGNDPYLVWAELSKGQGFKEGAIQVAVETTTNKPPWAKDLQNPANDPLPICQSEASRGAFWTGTLPKQETLKELIENNTLLVEFNQPRKVREDSAGIADLIFAPPVSIAKNIVAVIDIGCAFAHHQFLKLTSGSIDPRVRLLWDQDPDKTARRTVGGAGRQTEPWWPVNKFLYGRELTATDISSSIIRNTAGGEIDEDRVYHEADYAILEARRTHGTHVLDVLAGRIDPVSGKTDAASDADIIFVQLPIDAVEDTSGGSMTKYVLDALDYIFSKAQAADNLVINMSFGSTAGPHDGSSMLERAMDRLIQLEQARYPARNLRMVLPAGNYFLNQLHSSLHLEPDSKQPNKPVVGKLYWQVMPDDKTDTYLELWYPQSHAGQIEITVESPGNKNIGPVQVNTVRPFGSASSPALNVGAVIHSAHTPNGNKVMVLIALGPTHPDSWSTVEHGIWTVSVSLKNSPSPVDVMAWVERDDPLAGQRGQPQSFILANRSERRINSDDRPTDSVRRRTTGNSLANGQEPIVVGAYVKSSLEVSAYSAAGPTLNHRRPQNRSWPDICAPADESASQRGLIAAGTRSGIHVRMSGTSVAAPMVARAMLNAWAASPGGPAPSTSSPPTTSSSMLRERHGAVWLD